MQPLEAPLFPVVLAGPSGSGKTTIGRRLLAERDDLVFSVSATTRSPRKGERDGADYHFVTRERFEDMIAAGELLEWAEVHGELYGTPGVNLSAAVAEGVHLLLDIDVQGTRQVRRAAPGVVTVFLVPPTGEHVLQRLAGRGSEEAAALRRRLETALRELEAVGEFDYVVVNDDLETAIRTVDAILRGEEHRVERIRDQAVRRARQLGDEIEARWP